MGPKKLDKSNNDSDSDDVVDTKTIKNKKNGLDNSYGVHLLVDFTPIDNADKIILQCINFIQQAQTTIFSLPLPRNGVKSWRVKRRDTKLLQTYNELLPNVIKTETILRTILGEVVEKKLLLRLQAKHLLNRLESCINYNKEKIEITEQPMDELRNIINKLSTESSTLKNMIEFNKEIVRWNNVEKISKGQSVMRWGANNNAINNKNKLLNKKLTEEELMKDDIHPDIDTRLIVLRKLKEKFVAALAAVLEERGGYQVNLDNCNTAIEMINTIINKGSTMAVDSLELLKHPLSSSEDADADRKDSNEVYVTDKDETVNVAVAAFDHSRCADCSYGYSMTRDCIAHLEALQKQALDANDRLHQLVELREQVHEEADRLAIDLPPEALLGSPQGKASISSAVSVEESGDNLNNCNISTDNA